MFVSFGEGTDRSDPDGKGAEGEYTEGHYLESKSLEKGERCVANKLKLKMSWHGRTCEGEGQENLRGPFVVSHEVPCITLALDVKRLSHRFSGPEKI